MILLSQAQSDRTILAKQLGISEHQLSYITHSNSGEGLLFYGNVTIPFVDRFPKGEIYNLLTTRPEDMNGPPHAPERGTAGPEASHFGTKCPEVQVPAEKPAGTNCGVKAADGVPGREAGTPPGRSWQSKSRRKSPVRSNALAVLPDTVPFTVSCMARFLRWNMKMSARKAHTVLSWREKPRCRFGRRKCAVKSGNIRQRRYARPRPAIPKPRRTTIFRTAAEEHPELTKNAGVPLSGKSNGSAASTAKQAREAARQTAKAAEGTASVTGTPDCRAVEFA